MQLNTAFISELQFEAANTRKMLERVPFDNTDWKPHTKSHTVATLAKHVARIPEWIPLIINNEEVNLIQSPFPPYPEINSGAELADFFDQNINKAKAALESATNEDLMKTFTMRRGDHIIFNLPKAALIRSMSMNHLVHHRGQLSVYLRLLDVPVPGMYGPSADEQRPA